MVILRAAALLLALSPWAAQAASVNDIVQEQTRSIVYIQVETEDGKFMGNGTGFIISHDGYVVTAAHVKPEPGQRVWAVIGQREGPRYSLTQRAVDAQHDTALWQLPQSSVCRFAATLSDKPVEANSRVLAMGFPGNDGLTTTPLSVVNLSSADKGFYKADGFVRPGYSGGPVVDEDGRIIGIVSSGSPAGGNNDLVPISFAIALTKARNLQIGINTPAPFAESCYARCAAAAHGIERWQREEAWSAKTGEFPGGHNPKDECEALAARVTARIPGSQIDFAPGEEGQSGVGVKDWAGQMHYTFSCSGTLRAGPVYRVARSPACGLWGLQ